MYISTAKENLYNRVNLIRRCLGNLDYQYPVDSLFLVQKIPNTKVDECPFRTPGLRGMAAIGKNGKDNVILLNSKRSAAEKNYDCGHELLHICLHGNEGNTFKCFEGSKYNRNNFLEWQANEGAAELIVPYRILLPLILNNYDKYFGDDSSLGYYSFCEWAAYLFFVTPRVIEIRLESLKYEIDQFLSGVPIEKIQIMSQNDQKRFGINVESLADKENNKISKMFSRWDDFGCYVDDEFNVIHSISNF